MFAPTAGLGTPSFRTGSFEARPEPFGKTDPEAMLSAYRSRIHAFIRRRGFSGDDADDLTQETMLRAYRRISTFRGTYAGAWLCAIARNVTVEHVRKRRVSTVPLDEVQSIPTLDADMAERLAEEEREALVQAALVDLPDRYRTVLHLRYGEGRSLSEIADRMGCTPAAAKMCVFRAVGALRRRCRGCACEADLRSLSL